MNTIGSKSQSVRNKALFRLGYLGIAIACLLTEPFKVILSNITCDVPDLVDPDGVPEGFITNGQGRNSARFSVEPIPESDATKDLIERVDQWLLDQNVE